MVEVPAQLTALADAPPGALVITALAAVDSAGLSDAARIEIVRAWERQASWLSAMQAQAIAALDLASPGMSAVPEAIPHDDWAREELAAAMHWSPWTAERRLQIARALRSRTLGSAELLRYGEISWPHAACIVDETERLDLAGVGAVEARVLPGAPRQSPAEFRHSVRRAVLAVDPPAAEEAHARAAQGRYVRYWPVEDGMAQLSALLRAEDAATVMGRVRAQAGLLDGDTADQRRADAFVMVASGSDCATGSQPAITVTVRAETLAGADDAPAELGGYGPITARSARSARSARRLAADGAWRRALVAPATGHLLDLGRQVYRPTAALARFVVARDGRCVFPHCGVAATRCDLDHAVPFAAGGETNAANLSALCRRHHRAKHEGGWRLVREATGMIRWNSPTGTTYETRPPGYP